MTQASKMKERMKALAKFNAKRKNKYEELDIDTKIADLDSRIKRYERDLKGFQIPNYIIVNKLLMLKEQRKKLIDNKAKLVVTEELQNEIGKV